MNILLFGGTAEGRRLSRLFARSGANVALFVATDYGRDILTQEVNRTVYAERLDEEGMLSLMRAETFDYVIDATHPYARAVTQNIREASQRAGLAYIRLIRQSISDTRSMIYVPSAQAAAEWLNKTTGNIFLTVGSKELDAFTKIHAYAERVYARMIPMTESLQKAASLGFQPKNLILMQGPFDYATNRAMLSAVKAKYMLTKDSGDAGGFADKTSAALDLGCQVLVLARPAEESGLTYEEILARFGLTEPDLPENRAGGSLMGGSVQEGAPGSADSAFFPLFINMKRRRVLLVGGGVVATRRALILSRYGADIVVIAPKLTQELSQAVQEGRARHVCKLFAAEDIKRYRPFLVIAATGEREVNRSVMETAGEQDMLCIVSDRKDECSAWFAAIAENDVFSAGIVSKKGDHAAVKEMAKRLRRFLDE